MIKACYAAMLPAWWHTQKTMIHPVCIKIIDDCRSTSSPSACTRRRSCWAHVAKGSSATCCLIRPPPPADRILLWSHQQSPAVLSLLHLPLAQQRCRPSPSEQCQRAYAKPETLRRLERLILRIPSASNWPSCNSESPTKHFPTDSLERT